MIIFSKSNAEEMEAFAYTICSLLDAETRHAIIPDYVYYSWCDEDEDEEYSEENEDEDDECSEEDKDERYENAMEFWFESKPVLIHRSSDSSNSESNASFEVKSEYKELSEKYGGYMLFNADGSWDGDWEFYLGKARIEGKSVIVEDDFSEDGAVWDGTIDLANVANKLRKVYPDMRALGCVDMKYSGGGYYTFFASTGEKTIFESVDDEWLGSLFDLDYYECSVDEIIEDIDPDFAPEKLYTQMKQYLVENELNISVGEILDRLKLNKTKDFLTSDREVSEKLYLI